MLYCAHGRVKTPIMNAQPPIADVFWIGNPPLAVYLRRSARARRYSLRISNKDGRAMLAIPMRASLKSAREFAVQHESWIRRHINNRPAPIVPNIGGSVLFNGEETALVVGAGAQIRFDNGRLEFPARSAAAVPSALRGYLKTVAQQQMLAYSRHFAERLGCEFRQIRMRDVFGRWGSCNSRGDLMYSWRLVMAPRAVQSYVAAHEVAHLLEMNHSDAFWRLVCGVCPDYVAQKRWLRDNSGVLHSYVFSNNK